MQSFIHTTGKFLGRLTPELFKALAEVSPICSWKHFTQIKKKILKAFIQSNTIFLSIILHFF